MIKTIFADKFCTALFHTLSEANRYKLDCQEAGYRTVSGTKNYNGATVYTVRRYYNKKEGK